MEKQPFHAPVIASFNTSGKIKPLYIMINNSQLKIIESYIVSEEYSGVHFNCKVADEASGVYRSINLSYMHYEHMWTATIIN